jgi:hypothetical protein
LDYTRTQLLYTIHFVYLVFHANPSFFIVVFLFSFYLFDFIFVSSFDMYTGRLYFRGFIYFKFSLYAISSQLYFVLFFSFRKLLTEKLILRLYGGRCCRCVCIGLPWDDATIQALCRRQEFGGAEHGGRVPAAPAERGQRVAPGGHDGRGLPSPGLDAVAAAALRRSRLM